MPIEFQNSTKFESMLNKKQTGSVLLAIYWFHELKLSSDLYFFYWTVPQFRNCERKTAKLQILPSTKLPDITKEFQLQAFFSTALILD